VSIDRAIGSWEWQGKTGGLRRCTVVIQFGDFTLDTERRQLSAGHAEIHLTPKAYDLLAMLAERPSRPLSKIEIHDRLWPEIFVSDAALASLVKEIRAALKRHDPSGARWLRTFRRFGYSLACPADAPIPAGTPEPADVPHWFTWRDRHIPLGLGSHLIGRAPDASIRFSSPAISRRHARVTVDGSGVAIEDLGSKNGTRVNGPRIKRSTALGDGDEVRLGPVRMVFRVLDGGSTMTWIRTSRHHDR
jgi:DNA-binding winged helix-turn-helix (wHTH) protein